MGELSPQREKFCLKFIECANSSEAYRHAYPKSKKWKDSSVHVNSSQLLTDTKVKLRVQALRDMQLSKHLDTVESINIELNEAREMAVSLENPTAMISASMSKAKLQGMLIDRQEHSGNVTLNTILSDIDGDSHGLPTEKQD